MTADSSGGGGREEGAGVEDDDDGDDDVAGSCLVWVFLFLVVGFGGVLCLVVACIFFLEG